MKTNLKSLPNGEASAQRLAQALSQINLDDLARQTRFCRRQPKKLSPLVFIQSCCLILLPGKASLRAWALLIGLVQNLTYSKQALFKRLNAAALAFVQSILHVFLLRLTLGAARTLPPALAGFPRVLVHDSVVLTLSPRLAAAFPGSRRQRCAQGAMIRVQAFLDLKHEQFVHFWHSAYVKNDVASAGEGLEHLRRGDLFIRDLGFFVLTVLERLTERGINWLSRCKTNAGVFDLAGRDLDLVRALRGRDQLDRQVLLGRKERLPVRLVALKVPAAVANERRRKVRRSHGYQPTKKHCWLLGWNIYVTNVGPETWSARQVAQVYGLRWRLETTFKAWKQSFKMEDVPVGSPVQVEVLLYARLLFISLFEVNYLARCDYLIQRQPRPPISHLKLAALMPLYLSVELLRQFQPQVERALEKQVAYHCTYEKRKRKHFIDMLALS
jgi:hypothetical protein